MPGWVKSYRKMVDWEWFTTPNMFLLFHYLLYKANHKNGKWKGIHIKRGQLITGRKKLSEATGISERSIRTCLNNLKATNEVSIKSTNKFSIITICNYESYQGENPPSDQQNASKRPASDQQATTNKNNKKSNNAKESNKDIQDIVRKVFESWNSKKIIIHRSLKSFESCISGKLNDGYSGAELEDAINNYSIILSGGQFFWTHKYGLKEFLTRAGNLDRFLSVNDPFDSFKNKSSKKQKEGGYVEAGEKDYRS